MGIAARVAESLALRKEASSLLRATCVVPRDGDTTSLSLIARASGNDDAPRGIVDTPLGVARVAVAIRWRFHHGVLFAVRHDLDVKGSCNGGRGVEIADAVDDDRRNCPVASVTTTVMLLPVPFAPLQSFGSCVVG